MDIVLDWSGIIDSSAGHEKVVLNQAPPHNLHLCFSEWIIALILFVASDGPSF